MEKRIRQRLELLDAYRRQMEEKREKMEREQEEEDLFRQRVNIPLKMNVILDDGEIC